MPGKIWVRKGRHNQSRENDNKHSNKNKIRMGNSLTDLLMVDDLAKQPWFTLGGMPKHN